jgi:hypothetical protein
MPAGYSEKPLVQKLGIKPGMRALIVAAPRGYRRTLGPMPRAVNARFAAEAGGAAGAFDFIQLFVRTADALPRAIAAARKRVANDGMIWVSWQKRTSSTRSDVDGNIVRHAGLALDLVDVKVCAVDETWSGLKFVIPVKLRQAALKKRRV